MKVRYYFLDELVEKGLSTLHEDKPIVSNLFPNIQLSDIKVQVFEFKSEEEKDAFMSNTGENKGYILSSIADSCKPKQ